MKLRFDRLPHGLLFCLALLFVSQAGLAQRTVTGVVTDAETGEPLIGANILVVGTSNGTITDIDGTYSLSVEEGDATIEFSYTGYTSQRIDLGTSTVLDVAMTAGEQLEEIVVTGYTTQRQREVTSAITSVGEDDFNSGNVTNAAQLLQGKVPGLTVTQAGGNPNQQPQIRLRGLSTIGANTGPLVVIDGVIGADLNTVDPADIANISVLKDGSAAAVYGTRGASGVIIVTTKRAQTGVANVTYNVFGTAEVIAKTVPTLGPADYRRLGGNNIIDFNENTDWFDETTQDALSHTHNLSVSGGTGDFSYRASVNFRDNQGVAINTGFEQLNGRLNLQQKALNDRLTVDFQLTATNRNEQRGFNEAFRYATIFNPTAPIFSDAPSNEQYDGYFQQALFDYYNPVSILEQNVNDAQRKLILGSLRAEYELVRGLKLAAQYSLERTNETEGRYYDKNSFWVGANRNGLAENRNDESSQQYFLSTLSWVGDVGNGLSVNLLGGYEYQKLEFEGFGMSGGDFITDAFSYNNMGASLDFPNGLGSVFSYKNNYRNIAFFGRVQLNLDNTYFMTGSLRREGNSRFGEDNKWGWFPAISAGVTLSNLFSTSMFDNLKVRAGWGRTGNIPRESYLSLQRFGPTGNALVDGEWIPSYSPVSNPNPDLKWETMSDLSIGLDFSLFGYFLTGSFDYFSRTTNDLLLPFPVPVPPNLFGETDINIGELKNSGLEWSLQFAAVNKPNFTWTTGILGTYYLKNELVTLSTEDFDFGGVRDIANLGSPGQNNTPLIRIEEGAPIGQIWGQQYVGVDQTTGDWIFEEFLRDADGGIIGTDTTTLNENTNRRVIGNGLPKWQLSWTNQFTMGNFDLSFMIDGFFGHDLVNTFRAFYEAATPSVIGSYNVLESSFDGELAALTSAPAFSSLHVENASFVRLNNLNFGYTIPFDDSQAFRSIRVYVMGERLFYITNYKGVDPSPRLEDGTGTFRALAPGIDRRNTWFRTAAISLGAQFNF